MAKQALNYCVERDRLTTTRSGSRPRSVGLADTRTCPRVNTSEAGALQSVNCDSTCSARVVSAPSDEPAVVRTGNVPRRCAYYRTCCSERRPSLVTSRVVTAVYTFCISHEVCISSRGFQQNLPVWNSMRVDGSAYTAARMGRVCSTINRAK